MYITLDDLRKSLAEELLIALTNDEGIAVTLIDPANPAHAGIVARIAEAISSASGMIDGYCGMKYKVPFASLPLFMKEIAAHIAIHRLYLRRGDEGIPQARSESFVDAVKRLEGIARGEISPGLDPAPASPSVASSETNKELNDRIFTRSSLGGF